MRKLLAAIALTVACSGAQAALIVEFDLAAGTTGTVLAPTTIGADFSASSLVLTNADTTGGGLSSNHFYHDGWDTTINLGKFYELTLNSNTGNLSLDTASFSLEETSGSASYELRSSVDGFSATLASGAFTGGLVTDFIVDLSSLGAVSGPVSLRWYMANANAAARAGFANHQPGGLGAGLQDVGLDIRITGNAVPEPVSALLLGLGLLGAGALRRRHTA